MGKMHFKIFSIIVCVIIVFSLFAGCSNNNQKNDSKTDGAKGNVSHEPLTLTYFTESPALHGDSNNDLLPFQEIEKITGVHIEWKHSPPDDAGEQFNLMVASNDLTDIIECDWPTFYRGGFEEAEAQGLIIKLNDYIDDYAQNYLKCISLGGPDALKDIKTDSGGIYAFTHLLEKPEIMGVYFGPAIKEKWLTKFGLERPETIDEWDRMMRIWKEQDANGNGEADEIGLSFSPGEINMSGAFIGAYGIINDFYQDEGTVKFGYIEPAFKDFLAQMRTWYRDGLLDNEFSTGNRAEKISSEKVGAWLSWGSSLKNYEDPTFDKNPDKPNVLAVKYPSLKKGEKSSFSMIDRFVAPQGLWACISTACKKPVEAIKWLDFLYSEEGSTAINFGKEGVTYEFVDGKKVYTDLILRNTEFDTISETMNAFIYKKAMPYMQAVDVTNGIRYANLETTNSPEYWGMGSSDNKMWLPPLSPTLTEVETLSTYIDEIEQYCDDTWVKFVMGQESLDKFDDFVAQLKKMGIENAIQITQAQLDRYNSR